MIFFHWANVRCFCYAIYKCNKNQRDRRDPDLIGKLNPDIDSSFEVVKIEDKSQTKHFDVLKTHWESLWENSGGYRFVCTFFGAGLCWWLCCGYVGSSYGLALQLHYADDPTIYKIQNGVWANKQKIILASDLGYVDVTMNVTSGYNKVPNITGLNYIPIILRASHEYTGITVCGNLNENSWVVVSSVAQNISIRFFKYPR